MALFKLYMGQKMLKFWKLTSGNFKFGKLPRTSKTSNYEGLFVNKFDSKSCKFSRNLDFETIYRKK